VRIAIATAELSPFAKTGGLGDVTAALSRYLTRAGHDVRPFLPLYGNLNRADCDFKLVDFLQDVPLSMGRHHFRFSVFTATPPGSPCPVYFVACAPLYDRHATYTTDWDEHLRFAFLSRASIECCQRMGWSPDVFHVHDWHTALVPLYLRTVYAWDRLFGRTRTVLTLHNLAYQGVFPAHVVDDLGLGGAAELFHNEDLAAGILGFLKTGILYANALTAVSETFAREIQTPEHGFGLDGLLRARADSVFGIVNGVDYDEWSPENDPWIPYRYSARDLRGKARNKAHLLDALGLSQDPDRPLVGVVSRLTPQKGFDLAFDVLARLLEQRRIRLVALGSGAERYVHFFQGLAHRFPRDAAFRTGYRNDLAHAIEAGADLFLMPSLFEPCGLNQMYSLRYGTVPVVRRTGGLADTVRLYDETTGEGTGFVFDHFTSQGLAWALGYALDVWQDRKAWRRLMRNGMAEDFSWTRQVDRYVALYTRL
jgi:starch synthase